MKIIEGDRNQAIYGGGFDFSIDNIWKPRMEELEISGTYRLSDNIAEVVENFALDGRKMNSICQDKVNIKPHIIIYNDKNCSCKVIQKFAEIIRKNQRDHKIPAELKYPVKVVSWVVKKSEEGKITLPDYCPKFNREKSSSKIDFDSLESYLLNCGNIYRDIYNSIINACLKVLRLEEIKYEDKFYTKSSLMKYLRDEKPEEYEIFLQNLYHWSTLVIKKEQSKALSLIRDYIGCFLSLFSKSIKESYNFINDEAKAVEECNETDDYDCDSCKINGEKIEINSVHSVKGETHTATLYLESFYNKKYELDFISDMVLKKKVADKIKEIEMEIDRLKKELETLNGGRGSKTKEEGIKNKRKYIGNIKRYSKIVYVGFSRPTHLLAFAVHKDRYDKYLGKDIDRDFWEVVNVDDNSDVI